MQTGILAPLVPGNVAGWLALHETCGSMELEQLFAPAIGYAEGGFPVTHWCSQVMGVRADRLRAFDSSAGIILDGRGQCAEAGRAAVDAAVGRLVAGDRPGR